LGGNSKHRMGGGRLTGKIFADKVRKEGRASWEKLKGTGVFGGLECLGRKCAVNTKSVYPQ